MLVTSLSGIWRPRANQVMVERGLELEDTHVSWTLSPERSGPVPPEIVTRCGGTERKTGAHKLVTWRSAKWTGKKTKQGETESPVKAVRSESQRVWWIVLLSNITKGLKKRRRKQVSLWNGDQLNKLENNNNDRGNHQFKCFWHCSYVLFICEFKNKIK